MIINFQKIKRFQRLLFCRCHKSFSSNQLVISNTMSRRTDTITMIPITIFLIATELLQTEDRSAEHPDGSAYWFPVYSAAWYLPSYNGCRNCVRTMGYPRPVAHTACGAYNHYYVSRKNLQGILWLLWKRCLLLII